MANKLPPKTTGVTVNPTARPVNSSVSQRLSHDSNETRRESARLLITPPNHPYSVSSTTSSPKEESSPQKASSRQDSSSRQEASFSRLEAFARRDSYSRQDASSRRASSVSQNSQVKEWEKEISKTESDISQIKTLTEIEKDFYRGELRDTESEISVLKKLVEKKKNKKKELENKLGITRWSKFQEKMDVPIQEKTDDLTEKIEEESDEDTKEYGKF